MFQYSRRFRSPTSSTGRGPGYQAHVHTTHVPTGARAGPECPDRHRSNAPRRPFRRRRRHTTTDKPTAYEGREVDTKQPHPNRYPPISVHEYVKGVPTTRGRRGWCNAT